MAPQAVLQNGAATPEPRDRCARLHHGQGQERPAGYKFATRTYARQEAGSTRIIFRTISPCVKSASELAAVKDKPAVAAEDAAILDHRCARRRERNAVGAEECSQGGSNKRMDYKDQVPP